MRKKLISTILVAAMVASTLVGCGSAKETAATEAPAEAAAEAAATTEAATTEAASGDATNLVVAWWGNQTRNERTQAALDLYTEQNPNITFDGQFSEWSDYWDKLATSAAGNALPDVIQMDYKYLNQYVENGLLLDLTPYIEDGTLNVDNVATGLLDSGKVGDGTYAICIGENAPALAYNKTALDAAGITVKDNMTTDEFLALSKEVNEKTGLKTNISYDTGENWLEYAMRGIGYQFADADKLGVSSADDLYEFFKVYELGLDEGWLIDPAIFAELDAGSVEQNPMVYGSSEATMSWCAFMYTNQIVSLKAAAPEDMEIGYTTWPAADPKKANYLKPGQFFSVAATTAHPEEAVKILEYWTNSVDCNKILLGERGVPVSSEVAAAIAPDLDDITQSTITFLNDVVAPNSSPINDPVPDTFSEVYELINELVEKVCYKEMTAKEASEALYTQGNEILAK